MTEMHPRIATRALEPRYALREAAVFVDRPPSTVRRWTLGHMRTYAGQERLDEPLVFPDGEAGSPLPLSFLNLLELRFLASYRRRVPLQAIRRALEYAAKDLGESRPLLALDFQAHGRSLFLRYATEGEDPFFLNASQRGQLAWPQALEDFIRAVDYDKEEEVAHRWWPLGRDRPVIIDTLINAGLPSTARSGVRTVAIAARRGDGLVVHEIADDVGAAQDEVEAALVFEHVAA